MFRVCNSKIIFKKRPYNSAFFFHLSTSSLNTYILELIKDSFVFGLIHFNKLHFNCLCTFLDKIGTGKFGLTDKIGVKV